MSGKSIFGRWRTAAKNPLPFTSIRSSFPWFLIAPQRQVRNFAAATELFFQFMIIATGNYAWINFVGCVPIIASLDDGWMGWNDFQSRVRFETRVQRELLLSSCSPPGSISAAMASRCDPCKTAPTAC